MKKRLLIGLLCLSALGVKAQGTWVSQATNFTDVSSGVRNVSAVDSNVVWISSYDGSGGGASRQDFSRTTDGGNTWVAGTVTGVPASHDWSMIHAVDANNAWAVFYNATAGSGGGIWHTSDGGATWAQQGVGSIYNASSFPNVVHFWDLNVGFAMGDPNSTEFEIYTTTDGGATWNAVPGANIPDPLSGEYGIVYHYSVIGDNIWFDTNKGRVFHSADKGLNWTAASTGITVPANGAMDIVFYNDTNGVARLYNQTSGVNTSMKITSDGGATWTTATPIGNFFGSDVKYVPGTTARLVSTGAATGFIGSSYSDDGGINWVDIETSAQRTALGIIDSMTMWAGGFTTSPTSDGIFKYEVIVPVACGSPLASSGSGSVNDTIICFGDTLTFTVTGANPFTDGTTHGFSVIVSSGDLQQSNDPLNQPGVLGGTGVIPNPADPFLTILPNDGSIFAAGIYYFTPVVYGNATGTGNITQVTLDPACTITGPSVMVNLLDFGDPLCATAIAELNASQLKMNAFFTDNNNVDLKINAAVNGKANVTIYDVTGRKQFTTTLNVVNGSNHHVINVGELGTATYIIKVEVGTAQATSKLIKL